MDELEQQQFEEMQEFNIREMEMEYDMSVDKVLYERGKTHGDFTDNSLTSQKLKNVMRNTGKNWEKLSDVDKEGLEMIQHKIARFINGDSSHVDTIVDIIGYATLIRNKK